MDELFGQIDYRSKSDAMVMRLLRLAMDKAHENVQSMNGPMEFLHERSKFYELAVILVEGGLNIVQEEADIHEISREKILSDLMEIKDWLQRRNEEMRLLIIEKDKELLERIESELKLRQALELKERELVYLREKEELQRTKGEGFQEFLQRSGVSHDEAKGGDIRALKNSVDQQVWNIKQKLEDEKKSIKHRMRKTISNVSDGELYAKLSALSAEDDHLHWDDHFSGVKSLCRTLNPGKYNLMIRQMSSDIDILKGTFDIAFGRMENVELLPLEKRWRMIIERDAILVSIKGFISEVRKIFYQKFKKRNHCVPRDFCREKWTELIDDMTSLASELKALCSRYKIQERRLNKYESSGPSVDMRRTVSEPLPQVPFKPPEEESEASGGNFVSKMIKNHESIIHNHNKEWSWLTKEMLHRKESLSDIVKSDKEPDELEGRIHNAIRKLHNIIEWNDNLGDEKGFSDRVTFQKTSTENSEMRGDARDEISQLKDDRDCLNLQILLTEEIYLLLFEGLVKYLKVELRDYSGKNSIWDDSDSLSLKDFIDDPKLPNMKAGELKEQILLQHLDYILREDVRAIYMQEIMKEWNQCAECKDKKCLLQQEIYKLALKESVKGTQSTGNRLISRVEIEGSETFPDAVESLLREDVCLVYFKEMSRAWKMERDDYNIEMILKEDIYHFLMVEVVKEANVKTRESEILEQMNVPKDFPSVTDLDIQRGESLIENLDSLLEYCDEDGYLMVNATSETNEQRVRNEVILPSEDEDEDKTKEWLLTDGEKLEIVLHEVHTSKTLLLMLDMENSLVIPSDHQKQDDDSTQLNGAVAVETERKNTYCLEEDEMLQLDQSVLSPLKGFQQVLVDFEHLMHSNLDYKSLRIEKLKQQIEELVQPVASIRERKLLYKKAFVTRCQNLLLAENEVDLLGNQVEKLLCVLQRIYLILNQNSTALSRYFGVFDILNLIKRELAEGSLNVDIYIEANRSM